MKYQKKPLIVEASQFIENLLPHPVGVHYCSETLVYYINTPRGPFNIKNGDWIVTGVNGVIYPLSDEIFSQTYEEVKDAN